MSTTRSAPRGLLERGDEARSSGLLARARLFEALDTGLDRQVTLVSAPPGSGKTTLVRSWLAAHAGSAAAGWVDVRRDESDPSHFWGQVLDAIRASGVVSADSTLATLVPTTLADPAELLGHIGGGLNGLEEPLVLVLDDIHQLRSAEALAGLETLLADAPPTLHVVLMSRRDPRLGLHRLRLSGRLVEIRAANLEFTSDEAGELLREAGVSVAAADVAKLHERTEGWATGLRLAALSLARHPSPEQFVAEFAGSERTVADYLLGEVLLAQPPEVRDLLLRTCILDRVDGELADLLTGRSDGHRLLHELAEANALVVAVDVGRTSFRYHQLLLDLLRLDLRRELPGGEIEDLHGRAARWYAEHDQPIEAIRHARLAGAWDLACELLGRHWVPLLLDGEEATLSALLAGLPENLTATDGEVATMLAADHLRHARWAEADALLDVARSTIGAVPDPRRSRAEAALATVQLFRARQVGGVEDVVDEADNVVEEFLGTAEQGGADLGALALLNLGIAKAWTFRFEAAERDLQRGLALGRTIGRPYVEIGCLTALGNVATLTERIELGEQRLRDAIAVAERVGWTTHPLIGAAYMGLASTLLDRGMLAEGEQWLERADPILTRAPEPPASVGLRHAQGLLAMGQGRFEDALAAFEEGERLVDVLHAPHVFAAVERPWQLRARLALGDLDTVREALSAAPSTAEWCNLSARLHLALGEPEEALAALAPVHSGLAAAIHVNFNIEAWLLDALARRALGDRQATERSTENALALAEPDGRCGMILTIPGVHDLLSEHPVHRTAHASHLQLLCDLLAGVEPEPIVTPSTLEEPLKERELAVLRFLSTNLTAAEIGNELFLSVHTVKTHMRKLYAKLGVHTRAEAVQQGRALGLLAPARRMS